ncbi:MFS transporter [Actomonas aquatica]|uniref:MFS transporter n=1 Tax=Actomonas aquatica TaxID=2866162 RepID=A0ABZ1C8G7_9BACT|nr:MFS transporter [Opitutus sp. WL0086]WRQ87987.1 MFS transporter [Opitutus sp. WL0086]
MSNPSASVPAAEDAAAKLKMSEKVGYAFGDFASCLYFGIFMNFLTYYYTDVMVIGALAASAMIASVRTWDWINDAIMGVIADRTKSKMGRFRPWLIWMIPPYMIIGVLTFTAFDLSDSGRLVYAYITYTAITMVYTAINVPYSALMGVMTAKSEERTVLSSFRFVGAFAGTAVVSGTMLLLVKVLGGGNERLGFTLAVSVYAVIAAISFFITFKTSKERIKPPPAQKSNVWADLKGLAKNGPWVMMIIISVLTIIWIAVRGGVTIHYFKYVSGHTEWGGYFHLTSNIVQLVGVLFTKQIAEFLGGKRRAFIIINFASAIFIALFYFVPADNLPLLIGHQIISCAVSAPLMPLFWSMIADTADWGAWKLGQRSTGLLFSAGTLSQKIGWSLGPALSLVLLNSFGFIANQDQSPETIEGLRLIMSWIPAGFAVLAGVAVFFYKITPEVEKEMEAAIAANRSDEAAAS